MGNKHKILILEDVPTDADLVERELRRNGVEFISARAETRDDFVRKLKEFQPDLILSDYMLPQFTGMEALLIVKENSPYTPFIIVTGSINEEVAVDCINAGAWDYVTKDHLARLVPAIEGVFDRKKERELKRIAEEELKQANIDLSSANKELEQVLYITSHDLRSPLVNIQGYTEEIMLSLNELKSILNDKKDISEVKDKIKHIIDEELPESRQYILTSIAKMNSLLSGLLKISRLGRSKLETVYIDMNKLISDVLKNFSYKFKEKGIKQEVLDLLPCTGDYAQINMVFTNLMDNALKFSGPGMDGVIKIWGYDDNGQSVYCVEDNGVGISPEYHEKMFEIFHQLDPSCDGEGLGLYIIHTIVEKHNGKIWVESESGKGSRFYVSLPK